MSRIKFHGEESLEKTVWEDLTYLRSARQPFRRMPPIEIDRVRHAVRVALQIAKETGLESYSEKRELARQEYLLSDHILQREKAIEERNGKSPKIESYIQATEVSAASDLDEYIPDQDFDRFWE